MNDNIDKDIDRDSNDDGFETVSDDETRKDEYEVVSDELEHIEEEDEIKETEELIEQRKDDEEAEIDAEIAEEEAFEKNRTDEDYDDMAEEAREEIEEEIAREGWDGVSRPMEEDFDDFEEYFSAYADYKIQEKIDKVKKQRAAQAQAAAENSPAARQATFVANLSPEDRAKLEQRDEYTSIINDQIGKARQADLVGDTAKAHEHRQRAQVYIDELREVPVLDVHKNYGKGRVAASEQVISKNLTKYTHRQIENDRSRIEGHLSTHMSTSGKDYSFVIQEPTSILPGVKFNLKVVKIDHPGETSAEVRQNAEAHHISVFDYLARQGRVRVEITGKEDEKGVAEHRKSRPQPKYGDRMFPSPIKP